MEERTKKIINRFFFNQMMEILWVMCFAIFVVMSLLIASGIGYYVLVVLIGVESWNCEWLPLVGFVAASVIVSPCVWIVSNIKKAIKEVDYP